MYEPERKTGKKQEHDVSSTEKVRPPPKKNLFSARGLTHYTARCPNFRVFEINPIFN